MGEALGGGGRGACRWRCNARRSRKQRWPAGRHVAEEGGARRQATRGRSGVRAGQARGVSWLSVWAREVRVGAGLGRGAPGIGRSVSWTLGPVDGSSNLSP
jgi:hypothetical protein